MKQILVARVSSHRAGLTEGFGGNGGFLGTSGILDSILLSKKGAAESERKTFSTFLFHYTFTVVSSHFVNPEQRKPQER
jgi:hypothetical protein